MWSPASKADFYAYSQRARYLQSSALLCPPTPPTPLYAIQYLDHARAPIYLTEKVSLALLAAGNTYYLASTAELEGIIGMWKKNKAWKPSGPDPDRRLEQAPFLFDSQKQNTAEAQQKYAEMQNSRHDDIESLYKEILLRCRTGAGTVQPTLIASQIRDLIPRSSSPTQGVPLGTPAPGQTLPSAAEPRWARGRTRVTKKNNADALAREDPASLAKHSDGGGVRARDRGGRSKASDENRGKKGHHPPDWGQDDDEDDEELLKPWLGEEEGKDAMGDG